MQTKEYQITSTLPVTDGNHRDIVDIIAQATEGGPELPDNAVTDYHRRDRRDTELRWGHGSERLGRLLTLYELPGGELHARVYFDGTGRRIQERKDALLRGEPMTLGLIYTHTRNQGTGAEIWRFPALRLYPTPVQAEGED